MLSKGSFLALVCITFSFGSAMASQTSLGANYGITFYHPNSPDGNTVIIGLPASAVTFQPGIRLGVLDERMQNELYFDAGVLLLTGDGDTHLFEITANYQRALSPEKDTSPYVTAGVGVISAGAYGTGAVSPVFGGGLGLRAKLNNGHGAIRVEVRADQVVEGNDRGTRVIESATLVGFKGGFDIWLK